MPLVSEIHIIYVNLGTKNQHTHIHSLNIIEIINAPAVRSNILSKLIFASCV